MGHIVSEIEGMYYGKKVLNFSDVKIKNVYRYNEIGTNFHAEKKTLEIK